MPHTIIRRYLKHGMLPQLRLFEASARLGCFARAAEELHIAPPTASVQMKKLTETVGVPLFEQIGKRIYLTEAGRRLQASCNDMFRALCDFESTLADIRGLEAGHLSLAVTTTARVFAPRLLAVFIQQHPAIEISLQIHNRSTLLERLARNEDDLYIFADAPDDPGVVIQTLLANPLVVFARCDHPLARQVCIPFARLAEEPFLIRELGSGTRQTALELFRRHGVKPKIRMELGSNEAIREAILAGLGVSILSRYVLGLELEPSELVCLDVEGFPLESTWKFVYPIGKQLPPVARAFLDFARTGAKELAEGTLVNRTHTIPGRRARERLGGTRHAATDRVRLPGLSF